MRIGVIGTGTIASAVVEGIASAGHQIKVSQRNADRAARLAGMFPNVTTDTNQGVIETSDVVFIGTHADHAKAALKDLPFRPDHRVISLMAGPSLEDIATWVAPAQAEALMIPFPFIAQGNSPVLTYPASTLLESLFGGNNTVLACRTTEEMRACLSAQAVLSPVTMMLGQSANWLGSRIGSTARAEAFLRQLIGGSLLARPLDEPGVLAQMVDDLNTPGGLNAELREHLGKQGTYDELIRGLDRLEARQKEPK